MKWKEIGKTASGCSVFVPSEFSDRDADSVMAHVGDAVDFQGGRVYVSVVEGWLNFQSNP